MITLFTCFIQIFSMDASKMKSYLLLKLKRNFTFVYGLNLIKNLKKMFRNLLSTFLLCLTSSLGFGQTISISGSISTNSTWNVDTVKITGNIVILNNSILTIVPGTYVEFQGYFSINCHGRIRAIGNVSDSIKFSINDTTGYATPGNQAGGWSAIIFPISAGLTPSDTSIFKYCSFTYAKGVALLKSYGEIVVENCSFNNNNAGIDINYPQNPNRAIIKGNVFCNSRYGGVNLSDNCNSLIANNSFFNNNIGVATGNGGTTEFKNNEISNCLVGIWINNSAQGSFIDSNFIMNNQTGINLGHDSNMVISNNIIQYNGPIGGGIEANYSTTTIIHNNISYNTGNGGAAIFMRNPSEPLIAFNFISNNYSTGSGCGWTDGGAILSVQSNPIIINNIIANNETESAGGGVTLNNSSLGTIVNNTIVHNKANDGLGGGGLCFMWDYLNPVLINNIIWGNEAPNASKQIFVEAIGQPIDANYCLFSDTLITYPNEIIYQSPQFTNPLFVNPSGGAGLAFDGLMADWSIQANSPCINAGTIDTTGLGLYSFDIAGNQRVQYGRIDIGAYESNWDITTAIKNGFFDDNLFVFPNPTNSTINIVIKNRTSARMNLNITDVEGRTLMNENIESADFYLFRAIDLAHFNSGIYSVNLNVESGGVFCKSIVKN
jgi:hypothetical protein